MLEQKYREIYQKRLIKPVLKYLPSWLTPIHITLLSALMGLLFIPAMVSQQTGLAVIIILISGYLDTVDGSLARARQQCSDIGAVLDIMADRVVECAILTGFFLVYTSHQLLIFLMLASSLLCITSFLVVAIFEKNSAYKSFHYSVGLMERAEAFIFFIIMIVMPSIFMLMAILYSALVCWTAFIRVKEFYENYQSQCKWDQGG